jgi:hypothetical protein
VVIINNSWSIKFPFSDSEWLFKIIIGCALTLVPLINIVVLGYFLECIRLGTKGRAILPQWSQWQKYGRDGLAVLLIAGGYLLIPLAAFLLGAKVTIVSILMGCLGLLIPAALAGYAVSGQLSRAFQMKDITAQMARVVNQYLISYIIQVLVTVVSVMILVNIPVLAFASAFLIFYAGIVYWNYVGWLFQGLRG